MKEYKGKTVNDRPVHGGEYVEKTGNAGERYNFYTCSDGIVRGFVETKHQNGCYSVAPKPNKLHIENLDSRFTRANSIDGVTVIFCARHPERGTVIIGWYEHARVYRERQFFVDDGEERHFFIVALPENVHLIEHESRIFVIPRAKGDHQGGFGQSNVWYAKAEKDQDIKRRALEYIQALKDGNAVLDNTPSVAPARTICPRCGTALPDGAKFCLECGAKI